MSAEPNKVNYVVYELSTGDIVRSGHCSVRDVQLQAGDGQAVLLAEGSDVEDRVIMPSNGARPYVRRRAAADITARRPKAPIAVGIDELLTVLNEKHGLKITRSDLEAAARSRSGSA